MDPNPCDSNTICDNTKGSYRCNCQPGFILKDNKCVGNSVFFFLFLFVCALGWFFTLSCVSPFTNVQFKAYVTIAFIVGTFPICGETV